MIYWKKIIEMHLEFEGISIEQSPKVIPAFISFLNRIKNLSQIIELGAGFGGFSRFLASLKLCNILAVEKDKTKHPEKNNNHKNLEFIIGDYYLLAENIGKIIRKSGISVVLCDGGALGDKYNQLKTFMPYCKEGDYILSHDFMFPKHGGITEEQLVKLNEKFGFEPIYEDLMKLVYWSCSIKKEP